MNKQWVVTTPPTPPGTLCLLFFLSYCVVGTSVTAKQKWCQAFWDGPKFSIDGTFFSQVTDKCNIWVGFSGCLLGFKSHFFQISLRDLHMWVGKATDFLLLLVLCFNIC